MKTAVHELLEYFSSIGKDGILTQDQKEELIEKEKKQIMQSYLDGRNNRASESLNQRFLMEEDYYLNTFCETRCTGCGVCLDDKSELLQTEGYCEDCL